MQSALLGRLNYFLGEFYLYLILISLSLVAFVVLTYLIYKANYTARVKKILLALLSTVIFAILSISLFEFYFRFIYDQPDGLGFLKVNSKWHARHVVFNNYFFRDRDFDVDKKPGVTRIGVLGDSLTFGGGIENASDRFSNLIESKLRGDGFNVEVYNLGKSGYDTEGEIKEYERVKHLNFDIIVWQYFLNDIQPSEKSTGTSIINKNSQKASIVKFLSDTSHFFDFLYWRLSSKYQKTFSELRVADLNQYQNQELFESHRTQIADFTKSLKSQDKKVVVIIFPFLMSLGPNYPAADIHATMQDVFKINGADDVIDLLEDFRNKEGKDLMASKFDPHPNEIAHAIAADRLEKSLKLLLERR